MSVIEIFEYPELFRDVQMTRIFRDGKTFVDCLPKDTPENINRNYIQKKDEPGFRLDEFVRANFELPVPHSNGYHSDLSKSVEDNIEVLWDILTRQPDKVAGSLIPLPFPYIVPGGRFGEIYYWDSYFTMLGLKASGKIDMLESMVKNFSFLIDTVGHIPNGNRSYYLSRSQPPFFSLMVRLLSEINGKDILIAYLPQMEKEYAFWMKGSSQLDSEQDMRHHLIRMSGGELLNRYWDESDEPRPEAYREDMEVAEHSEQDAATIFHHLRAGAESGWDFSSRWFKDSKSLATIHVSDLVAVDLNCLLLRLEETIAEAHALDSNQESATAYAVRAEERKKAIQQYCWSEEQQFYVDFDAVANKQETELTLAAVYPLFFKVADERQAAAVASILSEKFLKSGGLLTTLVTTGEQWDAPNGWAPLQWMAIRGLQNYGHDELAKEIAQRWIKLNTDVFKRTGKLMEKYNVVDTDLEAGGGEYEGQDGFGWTNGVLVALMESIT